MKKKEKGRSWEHSGGARGGEEKPGGRRPSGPWHDTQPSRVHSQGPQVVYSEPRVIETVSAASASSQWAVPGRRAVRPLSHPDLCATRSPCAGRRGGRDGAEQRADARAASSTRGATPFPRRLEDVRAGPRAPRVPSTLLPGQACNRVTSGPAGPRRLLGLRSDESRDLPAPARCRSC